MDRRNFMFTASSTHLPLRQSTAILALTRTISRRSFRTTQPSLGCSVIWAQVRSASLGGIHCLSQNNTRKVVSRQVCCTRSQQTLALQFVERLLSLSMHNRSTRPRLLFALLTQLVILRIDSLTADWLLKSHRWTGVTTQKTT